MNETCDKGKRVEEAREAERSNPAVKAEVAAGKLMDIALG